MQCVRVGVHTLRTLFFLFDSIRFALMFHSKGTRYYLCALFSYPRTRYTINLRRRRAGFFSRMTKNDDSSLKSALRERANFTVCRRPIRGWLHILPLVDWLHNLPTVDWLHNLPTADWLHNLPTVDWLHNLPTAVGKLTSVFEN